MTETFTRRLGAMDERLSPSDLWHAEQAMKKTEDQLGARFESVDLWLTAAMPAPPAEVGSLSLAGGDEELQRRLFERVGFTPLANGTGLPALSIPVADAGPLPIGAHFLAPMGREDRLVGLAGQIERAHPWPRLAPGVREAA